jgi:hypothetical protein
MALLMTDGDTILAGCADFFSGGGVFRSTDNGATWTEVSSGLTNRLVQTLVRNGPGQLFAGTQAGVFRSTDNGDLWEPVNTGLTFPNIQSLSFNSSGVLFAGTFGGGVFRTTQSTTAVSEEEGETPVAFRLDQNYPNPFNPTSKIDFDMPEVGLVTLIVFDVLGQEVGRALDRRTFGPGLHSATIDAGELASGVYFYRLEVVDPAGGSLKFRTTMKMALVR